MRKTAKVTLEYYVPVLVTVLDTNIDPTRIPSKFPLTLRVIDPEDGTLVYRGYREIREGDEEILGPVDDELIRKARNIVNIYREVILEDIDSFLQRAYREEPESPRDAWYSVNPETGELQVIAEWTPPPVDNETP